MSHPFLSGPLPSNPRMFLRTLRIILFALCLGVGIFLGLAVYLRATGQYGPPNPDPVVSYTSAGFAVIAVVLSVLLPTVMESAWRKTGPREDGPTLPRAEGELSAAEARWWSLYQTRGILRAAILEGAAFFSAIAYLLEGQVWTPAIACGLVVLLLFGFPTEAGVRSWVDRQRALARQER